MKLQYFFGVGLIMMAFIGSCHFPKSQQGEGLEPIEQELMGYFMSHQITEADSLLSEVLQKAESTGETDAQIFAKINMARVLSLQNRFTESVDLLEAEKAFIEELGSPQRKSDLYIFLALAYEELGRRPEALMAINKSLEQIPEMDDLAIIADLYLTKSRILGTRQLSESLTWGYRALEIAQKIDHKIMLAGIRGYLAYLYYSVEEYESALEQFYVSRDLHKELDFKINIAISEHSISSVYYRLGHIEKAIEYINKAIELNRESQNHSFLASNYYNLGVFYIEIGEYEKALESLNLANSYIDLQETSSSSSSLNMLLKRGYGMYYMAVRQYEKALENIATYIRLADSQYDLNEQVRSRKLLLEYYEEQGIYNKAYEAYHEYYLFFDSLNTRNRSREIEEIHIAYEVDFKNAENEMLTQQLAYQVAVSEGHKTLLYFLFGALLVVLWFYFMILRHKKKLEWTRNELKSTNHGIIFKKRKLGSVNKKLVHLNKDKTALVDTIVHDLRNPLLGITSYMSVVDSHQMDEDNQAYLGIAQRSSDRLRGMIDRLLEVKKNDESIDCRNLQTVSVHNIVKDVVSAFTPRANQKHIQFETNLVDIHAETCPESLSRILDNLLSNAIKFSESGSIVKVESGRNNGFWYFRVSDQGPGFSETDKKNVFQMFRQLSAKPTSGEVSTGLGLYAVKHHTEKIGGNIILESQIGKGSCFTCRFPL